MITSSEYVPDALRLNPLLKQTIKRIISIDSQYRDVKIYRNASSYSFDLSEPIRDVVSLKLYSVQIPYTWYVISKSYGANFFYLKGAVNGINNGLHDYQIQIKFGNYSNLELITEVNNAFKDVSNNYPDVNFNNTGLSYDTAKSITTININIQKVYTEVYYKLNFPYWTPSVGQTPPNRLLSLASYFGFNKSVYYPYSMQSAQTEKTTNFINGDNKADFMFDASNNHFKVIHYIGPQTYDPFFSTVVETYTITLYDNIYNSNTERLLPVLSSAGTPIYKYTRQNIINMINAAIARANVFTLDSGIKRVDISGNVENAGNTCFQLDLKFDRNKVKYQPYSKMIVIFPTEDMTRYDNTSVWTIEENTQNENSCFYFNKTNNEFGEMISESTILQSSYTVGTNVNIFFKCVNPSYLVSRNDFSGNDFNISIPNGSYTLYSFISQLNTETQIAQSIGNTKGLLFANQTPFSINSESKFTFTGDMLKTFTESDYTISFDASSVLCKYMGFSPVTNGDLATLNEFSGTFEKASGYQLTERYLFTIKAKSTSANKYEPDRVVNIKSTGLSFANYQGFAAEVRNSIHTYNIVNEEIEDIQTPYSQSTFIASINAQQSHVTVTLKIFINYFLNEGNYQIEFLDGTTDISNTENAWNPFAIQQTYSLYDFTVNPNPPPTAFPNATIVGGIVTQNQITITDNNNTFEITPYYDASGGAYTPDNNITITVPTGTYIITQLQSEINRIFSENPVTYGSVMSIETISNNEYVKFRLNINKIYTSKDYNLVFYDPFSFVRCATGGQSVQNTTWDTTLGWILGFRSYTQYELIKENQNVNADFPESPYYLLSYDSVYKYSETINKTTHLLTNTIINFSGDAALTTNLYNYFVISLDDFNQNRINDGLVTVSRLQSSIEMPDYTSSSVKVCDPVTGKVVNKPSTTGRTKNKLTQKQIYSLNQADASHQPTAKTYSPGPFIKDLFGFVPIKTGPNGTYFIEYGGGLQLQERLYFGPVNIRKMAIQLMNDRGDLVDLNGSNWSFSFVIEQLYRSNSNSGNSK